MPLDDVIVNVSVSLGSPVVTRAGLQTPLIAGAATFAESIKRYTPSSSYATDSDLTADIKAMITAMFAQDKRVTTVAVGKIQADVAQVYTLTINAVGGAGEIFGVTINGTNFTYTSLGGDAPADVSLAVTGLVNGGAEPVTAADLVGSLTLTSDVAGTPDTIIEAATHTGDQTLAETTPNRSIKTELDSIQATDSDWYAIVPESNAELQITRAIEWAEASSLPRIVVAQTSDADIVTAVTTDLGSLMKTADYDRSILVWHASNSEKVAAAWASYSLAANPDEDEIWWSHKPLSGTFAATAPTSTQRGYLLSKNVNFLDTLGGVDIMYNGKLSSGNWIDEQIIADWMSVRVSEDLKQLLIDHSGRNEKIPMTDPGYATIGSVLWKWFNRGAVIGHFIKPEDGGTISVVLPSNDPNSDNPISSANRTARHVPISGSAQLSGAAQTITVNIDLVTS